MNELDRLTKPLAELREAFRSLTAELLQARQSVDALRVFMLSPQFRRAQKECELGYKVPDWVWDTWERWRRTEGSGNGRIMRD